MQRYCIKILYYGNILLALSFVPTTDVTIAFEILKKVVLLKLKTLLSTTGKATTLGKMNDICQLNCAMN